MSEWKRADLESAEIYIMFWRFMEMVVHRYGSAPTGALLTVLTLSLLDQVDYHPTVGELARILRLPKSTVSRYVSTEMNDGYIEEIIDPEDRRRRREEFDCQGLRLRTHRIQQQSGLEGLELGSFSWVVGRAGRHRYD